MAEKVTLVGVEQLVARLSLREQLELIVHVCQELSAATLTSPGMADKEKKSQHQREKEANEILTLCDAAAEQWEGKFDTATEIRRMRQERTKRVCRNKL